MDTMQPPSPPRNDKPEPQRPLAAPEEETNANRILPRILAAPEAGTRKVVQAAASSLGKVQAGILAAPEVGTRKVVQAAASSLEKVQAATSSLEKALPKLQRLMTAPEKQESRPGIGSRTRSVPDVTKPNAADATTSSSENGNTKKLEQFGAPSRRPTTRIKLLPQVQCHAREAEKQLIGQLLDKSSQNSQYLTIGGKPGVGKTSLVESTLALGSESARPQDCFFVSGKFEQMLVSGKHHTGHNSIRQPFSAILAALSDLIGSMWASQEEGKSQIKEFCEERSDRNGDMIQTFLPVLFDVAGIKGSKSRRRPGVSEHTSAISNTNVSERFRVLAYNILQCITEQCSKTVVVLLDDLHRADQPSLDLIQFLVEEDLPGLFLIGIYRSDEVAQGHPFMDHLDGLKDAAADRLSEINLLGFTVEELNSLFSKLTRKDKEETLPLVQVIHEKTGGNPFFVEQCCQLLQENGHMNYSFMKCQWEWDDAMKIRKTLSIVSTDVAEAVAGSMKKLDGGTQDVLKALSCVGTQIPCSMIKEHWGCSMEGSEEESKEETAIEAILESLVEMHILKQSSCSLFYEWAHDKLQQAAYSLMNEKECNQLQLSFGRLALQMSKQDTTEQSEVMVYIAAYLLNQVPVCLLRKVGMYLVFDLVSFNLQAAKLLLAKAAYYPAVELLEAGLTCLKTLGMRDLDPENSNCDPLQDSTQSLLSEPTDVHISSFLWKKKYGLCLELLNTLMETYISVGKHEESKEIIKEVLMNALAVEDKYRAQVCLISIKLSEKDRDYGHALRMYIDALKPYGMNLPENPSTFSLFREKCLLKKALPNGKLESLIYQPHMEDTKAMQVSRFLGNLSTDSCLHGNMKIALASSYGALRIACEHGVSIHTASALFSRGFVYRLQEKFGKSFICADLVSEMLKLPWMIEQKGSAKIMMAIHSSMISLKRPLQDSLQPFMDAYLRGIQEGDIETAFVAAMGYGYNYFFCGLPLEPLASDMKAYGEDARKFRIAASVRVQFPIFLQTAMNLQGLSQDPTILSGAAMSQEELLKKEVEGKGKSMTFRDICIFRLVLACVYRDLGTAKEMLDHLEEFPWFSPAIARCHLRIAFSGLAAFLLERTTREKKYKAISSKAVAYFGEAAKKGSLSAYPILSLLLAEKSPSKKSYDEAIRVCSRSGLLNFVAIAHESAGLFFQTEGDEEWSLLHLTKAMDHYGEWGATGKVKAMKYLHSLESAEGGAFSRNSSHYGQKNHRRSIVQMTQTVKF